jgi:hypothetical protein
MCGKRTRHADTILRAIAAGVIDTPARAAAWALEQDQLEWNEQMKDEARFHTLEEALRR